jgi:hypothetical protein
MDKNDLKIKKQENDNLQEIFYKGSLLFWKIIF